MAFPMERFAADKEARFQRRYAERSIPFIRVSLPIAVTLYHADFQLGGPVSGTLLVTWLGACLTGGDHVLCYPTITLLHAGVLPLLAGYFAWKHGLTSASGRWMN